MLKYSNIHSKMDVIKTGLYALMATHAVGGHNYDHCLLVEAHALQALEWEKLDAQTRLQIQLASLLHDVDDPKMFNTTNYSNARGLLKLGNFDDSFIEGIIEMIDLVSCSKNGSNTVPQRWMAIPHDCDRLEAIGVIGIRRCIEYNDHIKMPKHGIDTPRATTLEEVLNYATSERFRAYMNGRSSTSMIDHFYDKLLHIGQPHALVSQNRYILEEAERRNAIMAQYVVDYWKCNLVLF